MKNYKFLLWLGILHISLLKGIACTCLDVEPDIITGISSLINHNAFAYTVTIEGKIIGQGNIGSNPSLKVVVANTFYGSIAKDTIDILGSDGVDCFFTIPYTTGDRLICTISASVKDSIYGPVPCGFYYVKVVGDSVQGGALGSFTFGGYPYTSFIDTLMQTIASFTSNTSPNISSLSVYPNPVQQSLTVETENFPAKIVFYDMLGTQIFEQVLRDKQTIINMDIFPEGTYIYYIERKRLIIERGKLLKMN